MPSTHKTRWSRLAACAALTLAASAAQAELYNFSLTGSATASWQQDSSPEPSRVHGESFVVANVAGTFGGVNETAGLEFYATSFGGGMAIRSDSLRAFMDGPELYTGPLATPTLLLGSFALKDSDSPGIFYSLTISAVPEPATLALMLGGLGLLACAARQRRQR